MRNTEGRHQNAEAGIKRLTERVEILEGKILHTEAFKNFQEKVELR